jgi:glucosylceramidase
MKSILMICFTTLLISSCKSNQNTIETLSSLPDTRVMLQKGSINFSEDKTAKAQLFLYPEKECQIMDGVGAALTHASAEVLFKNLSKEKRDTVLRDLLLPEGIGMNYTRLCVGASDFAPDLFSYSENEDFTLSNFTIERDKAHVIPVLKEMLAIKPELQIMATPWSPPGWMKTNGSMVGGKLRPDCYGVYADYLIKFIQAYEAEGITIHSMTVQNEPEYGTAAYSCMDMTAEEQKIFIRDHLGPKLKKTGIETKIVLFDHNCDNPGYPIHILNDSIARQYAAGSGFHLYKGEIKALCEVKAAHPDKDIYFTEQSGGGWAPDFNQNVRWYTGHLFAGAMNCWSKNVLLWNLALDENDGPKNFGCQNCWGVIRVKTDGTIEHNGEYYAIAHYGKMVQPGAKRIVSEGKDISGVAFKNPDGSLVYLGVYYGKEAKKFVITTGRNQFEYEFKSGEVCTFKIPVKD